MPEIFLTILIAAATGFTAGMFGIGGSVVATPLPSAIISAGAGSLRYMWAGMVDFRMAGIAIAAAIPFGMAASWASGIIGGEILIVAKAGLLVFLGIRFLYIPKKSKKSENQSGGILTLILPGMLAGIISGLLAVGGGVVLVTAFNKLSGLEMKRAVATSLFCVGALALVNSLVHLSSGHIDPEIALVMMLLAWPFAIIGARFAMDMKNRALELAFGWAMIAFAVYFILYQIIDN